MHVTEHEKLAQVVELLKLKFTQAVIFCKTTERAVMLGEYLSNLAITCKTFVGRMKPNEREELYR